MMDVSEGALLTKEQSVEICSLVPKRVDFEFFGEPFSIFVATEREANQWKYFFRNELRNFSNAPYQAIYLVLETIKFSFMDSLHYKDKTPKTIYRREGNQMKCLSKFEYWSTVPTPIPPIFEEPLRDRLLIFNASAIGMKDGAVFFPARPYQGKSTLLNGWLRKGDSYPLADNITIIDRETGLILPFVTPTGIRVDTLRMFPELSSKIKLLPEERTTISPITGKVYFMHFDEIHECVTSSNPSMPRLIVFPNNIRGGMGEKYELIPVLGNDRIRILSSYEVGSGREEGREEALRKIINHSTLLKLNYDLNSCDLDLIIDELNNLIT